MVLSLGLVLNDPPMPSAAFCDAFAARLAASAESGVFSTRPRPKSGVGMRKLTLLAATSAAKLGCARLHPAGASERPAMVKRLCTLPSSGALMLLGLVEMKRTSRAGPLGVRNEGTVFLAPLSVAS